MNLSKTSYYKKADKAAIILANSLTSYFGKTKMKNLAAKTGCYTGFDFIKDEIMNEYCYNTATPVIESEFDALLEVGCIGGIADDSVKHIFETVYDKVKNSVEKRLASGI